jgi:hypothetical protein
VTDGAAALLKERQSRIKLTTEALHHRCALDEFPAIALGVAHGGGRDTAFQCSVSEEKAARSTEYAQRWEEGVKMFSVVDDL